MTVLAIDQGTTSTRALLLGGASAPRILLAREHRQFYPVAGRVEHDPEELLGAIEAALAATDVRVDAIGLANQGESCLGWDGKTGRPITPVIVWQDERTSDVTEALRADGAGPLVAERTGLPLDPYFSASKLGWIVREVPEARRLAAAGRLRLGTTDAFFRDRLTGRFETDVTTASRTSLMALDGCRWDPELCALFGVPLEALPRIGPSAGDLGRIRCGGHEAVFAASLVDQQAALYGHGCRAPGDAKITCGTGAFLLAVTGERPPAGTGVLPTVLWQKSGEPPVFGLDGGVYAAAAAVNWARRIGLFDSFDEIGTFAAPPAIGRGIAFVPALAGLAAPHWDRSARGAFAGLSLETVKADMIQAVLEGVALRIAEVATAVERFRPLAAPVALDGGMSANPYFTQFLADAMGRDLLVAEVPEVTALGAGLLASEAAGERTGETVTPNRDGRRVSARPLPAGTRETFAAAVAAVTRFAQGERA